MSAPPAPAASDPPATRSRVVIVHDATATDAFTPQPDAVRRMVQRGLAQLTGLPTPAAAWQSLVGAKEVVGLKVYSGPGRDSGTRPAVIAALIEGLLEAGHPATNIVIWDRQRSDLRRAGYMDLAARYHVGVEGSLNAGYSEEQFYSPERPFLGQLIWGDVEFGRKGEGIGRRSFFSKLLTSRITRIINVTPLLNHNQMGVIGHLYSLALGSVDNTLRFEHDLARLTTAVPEIYALPWLSDRVILNVTDALICQYEGEQQSLLHYSTPLNEVRLSKDPVALDVLSLRELERARLAANLNQPPGPGSAPELEMFRNAALLELGVSDLENIKVERLE